MTVTWHVGAQVASDKCLDSPRTLSMHLTVILKTSPQSLEQAAPERRAGEPCVWLFLPLPWSCVCDHFLSSPTVRCTLVLGCLNAGTQSPKSGVTGSIWEGPFKPLSEGKHKTPFPDHPQYSRLPFRACPFPPKRVLRSGMKGPRTGQLVGL